MTLQELNYFVTVARYRSYTRAAEECYITQPALSRSIARLEEELGCRLFDRNTKQVTLTAAGLLCLQDAQEILDKCELLRVHARGTRRLSYTLTVGYINAGHLTRINTLLAENRSLFQFDTEHGSFLQLKQKLLEGKLDIILVPKVNCEGVPGLRYLRLDQSRLCVLVHKSHRLAKRESLLMREVSQEYFIAWDENELPGANRAHCRACQEKGFTPTYVATGKKLGDLLMLLRRYNAAALTSQNLEDTTPPDFVLIPLADSPEDFGTACAWREHNQAPAILCLENALRQRGQAGDLLPKVMNPKETDVF